MEEPQKQDNYRPGMFRKGVSGNPGGRPKGSKSLKTFVKEYLEGLSDEDKLTFMEGLPKEIIWKMAEGNPTDKSENTNTVKIIEASKEGIAKYGLSTSKPSNDII